VVNTILVDFRALDTLGEATVLGIAAVGLIVLLRGTGAFAEPDRRAGKGPRITDTMLFQVTNRLLAPAMLLLSGYLFLRGHSAPGGGFIAALVAGAAVAYGWVAQGHPGGTVPVLRALRAGPLVGVGLLVCTTVGLAAPVAGEPFLTPLHVELAGLSLSSSLLFDLGVYLFVLGLVVASVDRLGAPAPAGAGSEAEAEAEAATEDELTHDGRGVRSGGGT
jgi:multicomponent Na+:H+ antiporter subunit A